MAVSINRVRSGRVNSRGNLSYSIEASSLVPAGAVLRAGKPTYLFSEVGNGALPILIHGTSGDDIIQFLNQRRDIRFAIQGKNLDWDSDEAARGATTTMDDFSIWVRWYAFDTKNNPIEIHDAKMTIFKNVTMAVVGGGGGAVGGEFSSGAFNAFTNAKDMSLMAPDTAELPVSSKIRAKFSRLAHRKPPAGGGGGKVGLMLHYLPMGRTSVDTEYVRLHARRLAEIAQTL